MSPKDETHTDKVFSLRVPVAPRGCLIADSPHSGRDYPADFGQACPRHELEKAEDRFLDRLYDFLPALGVPLLQAEFPRSYVDPNRRDTVTEKFLKEGEQEYIPAESGLVRARCTPRSSHDVYDRPLKLSEVFNRVAAKHKPYHDALDALVDKTQAREGLAVHLNCHSMPSLTQRGKAKNPFDVALGTRGGTSCDPAIVQKLKELFEAKGYTVGIDVKGFSGAEIIRRTGNPAKGVHSIQLELNRALYMDEETLEFTAGAVKLKEDLKDIVRDFAAYCETLKPKPFKPKGPTASP
ncbi:MAG: N-formylglutamate amidohydrolase [Alphaproteobacteria bacterium]